MYHNFFIHSSVDGHLGCFHVLAIVNRATMNIGVHVSFRTMFFSGFAFLRDEFRCGVEDMLEGNEIRDGEKWVACDRGPERDHDNLKLKAEPSSHIGGLEGKKVTLVEEWAHEEGASI